MRITLPAALALVALAACAPPRRPAGAPSSAAAAKVDETPPPDLSPNRAKDWRNEPGVRSAPKPLIVGGPRSVQCGKLTGAIDPKGAEVKDLLGGRLRVSAAASMKPVVTSADRLAEAEESRLVYERGGEGLAVVARETFQLDPDRYELEDGPTRPETLDREAPKFLRATFGAEGKLDVDPVLVDNGGERAYVARPRQPNAPPGQDTALVLAMLVAHPDGTLQSVAFYVRGEMVRNAVGGALEGCTRLAERVAQTVSIGPRALERSAGLRRITAVTESSDLAVRVPSDYVVVGQRADSVRIYKLRPLSLYPGNIDIALSPKPTDNPPKDASVAVDGKLLGKDVHWRGKTSPKGGYLFASETLGGADEKSAARAKFAAVLVKATRQAKVLDEFRGVAETLAVVPHR